MQAHYGYIKGTRAADGDEVDCYLGPNEMSQQAYIVTQLKKDTGEFDEVKLMLGFNSEEEAKTMYLNHYSNDARFFGGIVPYHMEVLKTALLDNNYNPCILKSNFKSLSDIAEITKKNTYFRKVIFTGEKSQLVVMSIKPNEDIGKETHEHIEQIIFLMEGTAIVELGDKRHNFESGEVVTIPPKTAHNIINEGKTPLKICTIYAPPNHIDGRIHKTKEDAEKDTADEEFGNRVIKSN